MQAHQTMFKKTLKYASQQLPPFAPFHTLFTDKTRTRTLVEHQNPIVRLRGAFLDH
jgi:hypothetical protein